jgi:hypothetical protein
VKYIFLHIEKTAGTSLVSYIKDSVGENNFYYTRPELLNDKKIVEQELNQYEALAGHIRYEQITKNYEDVFKITFLRHPIERILSFYYYAKEVHETKDHITIQSKKLDLLDFLDYCKEKNDRRFINGMTFKLANSCLQTEELSSAKKNLLDIDFIGIQENFDESLSLLSYLTGWKPVDVVPTTNRTKQRSNKNELSNDIINKIKEINKDDFELYDYGLKLFHQKRKDVLMRLIEQNYNGTYNDN